MANTRRQRNRPYCLPAAALNSSSCYRKNAVETTRAKARDEERREGAPHVDDPPDGVFDVVAGVAGAVDVTETSVVLIVRDVVKPEFVGATVSVVAEALVPPLLDDEDAVVLLEPPLLVGTLLVDVTLLVVTEGFCESVPVTPSEGAEVAELEEAGEKEDPAGELEGVALLVTDPTTDVNGEDAAGEDDESECPTVEVVEMELGGALSTEVGTGIAAVSLSTNDDNEPSMELSLGGTSLSTAIRKRWTGKSGLARCPLQLGRGTETRHDLRTGSICGHVHRELSRSCQIARLRRGHGAMSRVAAFHLGRTRTRLIASQLYVCARAGAQGTETKSTVCDVLERQ